MSSISVYAGSRALNLIQKQGIDQSMFNAIAGASGGPKWFTLFGLDCYLFGEFFAQRKDPIYAIGSSAGAWRMACFAQEDPVAAIGRLAHYYSRETYSKKPDIDEISDKAIQMLDKVLGTTGEQEIVNSQIVQCHFIVARAKGLAKSEKKWVQLTGLLAAAIANAIARPKIANHFDRLVFYTKNKHFAQPFFQGGPFSTEFIPLTVDNVHSSLLASGAIPLVLRGITDIVGAPEGVYRDGGIIDYHLDLPFSEEKLVLYPHFFPQLKPGWFDKHLNRQAQLNHFQNVVLVTPSETHINALPYQKISDRTDFNTMDEKQRLNYWQTVLDQSHRMADDFKALVEKQQGIEHILPIEDILKRQ